MSIFELSPKESICISWGGGEWKPPAQQNAPGSFLVAKGAGASLKAKVNKNVENPSGTAEKRKKKSFHPTGYNPPTYKVNNGQSVFQAFRNEQHLNYRLGFRKKYFPNFPGEREFH